MSDQTDAARVRPVRNRPQRDQGMTLPELLISIVVLGVVLSVLMAGVSVTLRQGADTSGRIDVARWEQNLGMWLPDDLSSASTITVDPGDSPCGAPSCPGVGTLGGSNVLMLAWIENGETTTVSYRYREDATAPSACSASICTGGSLLAPPACSAICRRPWTRWATRSHWSPGDLVPANIIEVDVPSAVGPVDS